MILLQIVPFLFIGIGLLSLFFPQKALFWNAGWRRRDAEPGEAALLMSRIGGLLAFGIGIFLLFADS